MAKALRKTRAANEPRIAPRPVRPVDPDVDPTPALGRHHLVDGGVDGRVLAPDPHACDQPGGVEVHQPAGVVAGGEGGRTGAEQVQQQVMTSSRRPSWSDGPGWCCGSVPGSPRSCSLAALLAPWDRHGEHPAESQAPHHSIRIKRSTAMIRGRMRRPRSALTRPRTAHSSGFSMPPGRRIHPKRMMAASPTVSTVGSTVSACRLTKGRHRMRADASDRDARTQSPELTRRVMPVLRSRAGRKLPCAPAGAQLRRGDRARVSAMGDKTQPGAVP
jgi:hypothetical protein